MAAFIDQVFQIYELQTSQFLGIKYCLATHTCILRMFMVEAGAEDFVSGDYRSDGNRDTNEGDSGYEAGHSSSDNHENYPRLSVVTDNCDVTTAEVGFLTSWMIMRKKSFPCYPDLLYWSNYH